MEYFNNIKQQIPPKFLPYMQLFLTCATSFYHNCKASGLCIYRLLSSYDSKSISASTFIEYVNDEVKSSNDKNVFESGVWLCTFYLMYCTYLLLWYVAFGLLFILLFPTLCWLFLWGIVLFVKDKFLENKTQNQVINEMNELSGTLFVQENELLLKKTNHNLKEDKLD